jgi:hypothetical protein
MRKTIRREGEMSSVSAAALHQFWIREAYEFSAPAAYYIYIPKPSLKAFPLQVWSGPEGSRKLRLPDFMTTALDGGKVVSLTHRPPLHPGNTPGTHFRPSLKYSQKLGREPTETNTPSTTSQLK